MVLKDVHEQNRKSWNEATKAHNSHKGDQAAFYRAGHGKLYPEETDLLGDIRGLSVVHLQCNSGQDTLSLALLRANVLGVDISDEAIRFAKQLSAESGVPARFVRGDVYDWLESESAPGGERFDVVFCSYGAIVWLSDLATWARGLAAVLKPGGRFVLVEFHPVMGMYGGDEAMTRRFDYFGGGQPMEWEDGIGDYIAVTYGGARASEDGAPGGKAGPGYEPGIENFRNPEKVYEFSWATSDVITALIDAGLRVESFREYSYSNGFRPFPSLVPDEGHERAWTLPPDVPNLPLMYSVVARK
jgi:SAM-dependent methyltransferase